jgi:hypothetical protein
MRWLGGVETPVKEQHPLTYRDEQTSAADGTYWISRIPRPILILRDGADGVEPHMLLSAAHAEESLVSRGSDQAGLHRSPPPEQFVADSPLAGFEPSVPA